MPPAMKALVVEISVSTGCWQGALYTVIHTAYPVVVDILSGGVLDDVYARMVCKIARRRTKV